MFHAASKDFEGAHFSVLTPLYKWPPVSSIQCRRVLLLAEVFTVFSLPSLMLTKTLIIQCQRVS